jgi:O-antigen/teichoic acid export membrane protein
MTMARMTRLQFTPLLIGSLLSPAAVTMYSIAKRLLDYTERLFASVTGILMPIAAAQQARGDHAGSETMMLRGGAAMTTLAVLFVAFCLCLGQRLIELWMGTRWSDASALLRILAVGEGIAFTQCVTGYILLGTARHKVQAAFQVVEVIAIAGLALILAPRLGLTGLCLALAIPGALFRGVAIVIYGCHVAKVPLLRYVRRALLPGLLAGAGPAFLLTLAVRHRTPGNWAEFVTYAATFGAISLMSCAVALGVPLDVVWRRAGISLGTVSTAPARASVHELE